MRQSILFVGLIVTMMVASSSAFVNKAGNKVVNRPTIVGGSEVDGDDFYGFCKDILDSNVPSSLGNDGIVKPSAFINEAGEKVVNRPTVVGKSDANSDDIYHLCKDILDGKVPGDKPLGKGGVVTSPARTQEGNNPAGQ